MLASLLASQSESLSASLLELLSASQSAFRLGSALESQSESA